MCLSNVLRLLAFVSICATAACQPLVNSPPVTPVCATCPACATSAPVASCATIVVTAITVMPVAATTPPQAHATPMPGTQVPPPAGQPAVTADDTTNVRSGPGTNYTVLGQLSAGETVRAIGRNSDSSWWQIVFIDSPDGIAWTFGKLVTANAAASSLPIVAAPPPPTSQPAPTRPPTATSAPRPITYTVQPGDTLLDLALRFNVTVEAIMAANGMTEPVLTTGQVLLIPVPMATPTPGVSRFGCGLPAGVGERYVVQSGDTLFGIAYGYGVNVELLLYANCINAYSFTPFYLGQVLYIPPPAWTPVPWSTRTP